MLCQFQEEEEEETTGIDKTLEIDEETADSASDKDEEEATDSDLDKREDAVAGKTNVTVYGEIKKGYRPLHESTIGLHVSSTTDPKYMT